MVPVQELTKDLEARCGLMAAVGAAGAQLVQLGGEEGGGGTPDPAQTPLQAQLRQLDLDWSSLLADLPAFQTALQEVRCPPPSPLEQV